MNDYPWYYEAHPDLYWALSENPPRPPLSGEIVEVLAHIDGQNDGPNWHWIVMLDSGQFAYLTGGCDYTGWG